MACQVPELNRRTTVQLHSVPNYYRTNAFWLLTDKAHLWHCGLAMTNQTETAQNINAIRRNAGNPMTSCSICGRAANTPHRMSDDAGTVVEGCVDAFHVDHADAWWARAGAAKMRTETLAWLRSL